VLVAACVEPAPLRVVVRSSLLDAALYLLFAGAGAAIAVEVMGRPIGELLDGSMGGFLWARTCLGVPLGLLFTAKAVVLLAFAARTVLRFFVPNVISHEGDAIRVRVASTWGRRTDAWLARAAIDKVDLKANQFAASFDVSISLATGGTIFVAKDAPPPKARRLAAQLEQMIWHATQKQWPLPRARIRQTAGNGSRSSRRMPHQFARPKPPREGSTPGCE
jgi:hypothetical protein